MVGILPVGLSQRPLLDLLAAVERDLLGVRYHAGVHVPLEVHYNLRRQQAGQ